MRTTTTTLAIVLAAVASVSITTWSIRHASPAMAGTLVSAGAPAAPIAAADLAPADPEPSEPGPTAAEVDQRVDRLANYTLRVMQGWPHAIAAVPAVDYEPLARDIAEGVLAEPPAVPGDVDRHKSAALIAALGYWEGARYAAYVDSGDCNAWARLRWLHKPQPPEAGVMLRWGTCDGGLAHSLWQIHSMVVQRDVDDGWENMTPDKLHERPYAIRMAIMLARRAMRSGDLCGYTGESSALGCPKAEQRLKFAQKAWERTPLDRPE